MKLLEKGDLLPLLATMSEWAMACYPSEACGLLLEKDGALRVLRCENLQDALHARDPERFPRTSKSAYNLDPFVVEDRQDEGYAVRAVFHSHPEVGAYFSAEDVLSALAGDPDGDPVLPGAEYLVLSARAAGVDDWKLFTWDAARRTFTERISQA